MPTRYLAERLNPGFGFFYTINHSIHKRQTDYQLLEVVHTEEMGKVMLLDNITQVAERRDWLYHETMVHPALTAHPDPRSVAIIGAGDGGIAREVLKHHPQQVVQAELDGQVVDVCREHFPEMSQGAFEDSRVSLEIGDGRKYLETTDNRFDTIIMDMTDPFGPSTMLYTKDFYEAVQSRLRDENGMFVMHAESPISRPRAYQQILGTLGEVFTYTNVFYIYIQMYAVLWAVAVSSNRPLVNAITSDEIANRLLQRHIEGLEVYSPQTHYAMQVEYPYVARLRGAARDLPVITDANPRFADEIDINRDQSELVITAKDS